MASNHIVVSSRGDPDAFDSLQPPEDWEQVEVMQEALEKVLSSLMDLIPKEDFQAGRLFAPKGLENATP